MYNTLISLMFSKQIKWKQESELNELNNEIDQLD